MRFYYLIITIFLQALNLVAQPADAVKLSPEQIALIQNQGAAGIQTVFGELGIQIQDLKSVEEFTYEVVSSQINGSDTSEVITDIASNITISIAEIASAENVDPSYLIEHTSAGTLRSVIKATQNGKIDFFEAIKAASTGLSSGAIQFAVDSGIDFEKAASAASSGSSAGAIEAAKENNLNVSQALEASASGLVSAAIYTSTKLNIELTKTILGATAGLSEGAIEASVNGDLDLIPNIKTTAMAASKVAVESATEADIDVTQTLKVVSMGITEGAFRVMPGNGKNIRIIIEPIKDINLIELQQAIESGIFAGTKSAGFIPIIETPFEDDPSIRQVSPIF